MAVALSTPLLLPIRSARSSRRQDLVFWDVTGFLASAPKKKVEIFLSLRWL
jgi:hypothetical protein